MKITAKRTHRTRCVYCHDQVLSVRARRCSRCNALYHAGCLQEDLDGSCATLGCRESPAPARLVLHYVRCCRNTLPWERHYQCDRCDTIRHQCCMPLGIYCCPGAEMIHVAAVGPPPRPRMTQRAPIRQAEDAYLLHYSVLVLGVVGMLLLFLLLNLTLA